MNVVYVTKIHVYVTTKAFINVSQLSLQEDILDFNVQCPRQLYHAISVSAETAITMLLQNCSQTDISNIFGLSIRPIN